MQKKRSFRNFLLVGAALVTLMGVVYSVDYVFNNVLEPHQRIRISVLLGTEDDPKGAGYNVNQSKIAIGSGGLLGKGYLQGTQTKYDFVPEQATDFIFCTVGEEWGFVGSFVIIALFTLLIVRVFYIAERQRSSFSRIFGYGVGCVLFFHLVVNIGMTIGLMPVIGIPLPFFSYGGSSLIGFTMLLFIFIKLDAYRMQQLR
jgi:rod shape determining protein RodA